MFVPLSVAGGGLGQCSCPANRDSCRTSINLEKVCTAQTSFLLSALWRHTHTQTQTCGESEKPYQRNPHTSHLSLLSFSQCSHTDPFPSLPLSRTRSVTESCAILHHSVLYMSCAMMQQTAGREEFVLNDVEINCMFPACVGSGDRLLSQRSKRSRIRGVYLNKNNGKSVPLTVTQTA